MAIFLVLSNSALSPQRIEAESVRYNEDVKMWIFRDAATKPVAWVPRECANTVAEVDVVNQP